MPEVTSQEFVVTGYVREQFTGVIYTTQVYGDAVYYRFESRPNEVWVDADGDGWWDYGRRDNGYGHWDTFDGFVWRDAKGHIVPGQNEDPPIGGGEARIGEFDGSQLFSEQTQTVFDDAMPPFQPTGDDGWIL